MIDPIPPEHLPPDHRLMRGTKRVKYMQKCHHCGNMFVSPLPVAFCSENCDHDDLSRYMNRRWPKK